MYHAPSARDSPASSSPGGSGGGEGEGESGAEGEGEGEGAGEGEGVPETVGEGVLVGVAPPLCVLVGVAEEEGVFEALAVAVAVPDAAAVAVAVSEAAAVATAVSEAAAVAVAVLEAAADAVAVPEADSVGELAAEDVDDAVEGAVLVPLEEAVAQREGAEEGDVVAAALREAEADTVGVQELAPHSTGAGASPPKRMPASALLNVAAAATAGTPVTLKRSTQFCTSHEPPALAHAVHAPVPHASQATKPGPRRPPSQRVAFASTTQAPALSRNVNASWEPVLSSHSRSSREGLMKPPDVHCSVDASACDAENPVPGSSASALLLPDVGAVAPPTVSSPR